MTRFLRWTFATAFVLIAAWLTVAWIEAEKEIRILCTMIDPGNDLASAVRTLDTGTFLRYGIEGAGSEQILTVTSSYNAGRTRCVVRLADSTVVASTYHE